MMAHMGACQKITHLTIPESMLRQMFRAEKSLQKAYVSTRFRVWGLGSRV